MDSDEVREAISEQVNAIVGAVRTALEQMPPELAADLIDFGIMLAGGGALLKNLDLLLRSETKLPIKIAADPLSAVAVGAGDGSEQPGDLEKPGEIAHQEAGLLGSLPYMPRIRVIALRPKRLNTIGVRIRVRIQ